MRHKQVTSLLKNHLKQLTTLITKLISTSLRYFFLYFEKLHHFIVHQFFCFFLTKLFSHQFEVFKMPDCKEEKKDAHHFVIAPI